MMVRVYLCDTDAVWPGERRLLNLEVEKSRQGDGIEKPGSETDNSNKEECQTNINRLHTSNKEEMSTLNTCKADPAFT